MILLCVYAATFLSKAVMTIFFDHYFEESLSSSTDMVYTCNKIPILLIFQVAIMFVHVTIQVVI